MYTLNRILPDNTRRPVGHRLGQPVTDDLACEVLEGEAVEIGCDGAVLLRYALDLDGVTEQLDYAPGSVTVQRGATAGGGHGVHAHVGAVVWFDGDIVGTITLLDDQRSYVKVFPTGLPVASPPDA